MKKLMLACLALFGFVLGNLVDMQAYRTAPSAQVMGCDKAYSSEMEEENGEDYRYQTTYSGEMGEGDEGEEYSVSREYGMQKNPTTATYGNTVNYAMEEEEEGEEE